MYLYTVTGAVGEEGYLRPCKRAAILPEKMSMST